MATILPHTTRATGTVLTAAIYNGDHQVHITNANSLNTQLIGIADVAIVTGLVVSNGASSITGVTIAGTANEISVANGNGLTGNPTLSLPAAMTLTGKTVTGGTFNDPIIGGSPSITLVDAGASVGPILDIYRNSASPLAADVLGQINFTGMDSSGAKTTYGYINTTIVDPVNATEDGGMNIGIIVAGALVNRLTLTATGGTFNGVLTITG